MYAHPEEANANLIAKRFPLMAEGPQDGRQWYPLLDDLPKFLRHLFPRRVQARELVQELFQHLDYYTPGCVVRLSDAKAAERTGIDRRDLQETRESAAFNRWVRVCPGEVRRAGFEPLATVYDLHKLMLAYNSWHALQDDGTKSTLETDLESLITKRTLTGDAATKEWECQ